MVHYKIIPGKRLIIEYFIGSLTLEEMFQFVETVKNEKDYDKTFNSLIDLNEVKLNISIKDIQKYVEYLNGDASVLGSRKLAIITKTPDHVVTGTLYQLLSENLPMNIRVFSTFEAAVRWLGLHSFTIDDYTNIVKELKG